MATIEQLEERIRQLEYRVKELLGLVSDEIDPFAHFILSEEFTEEQADALLTLMGEVRREIDAGKPPSVTDFEFRVYDIIPARHGDYHFVARFIRSLKKDRYDDVYNYLKGQGMGNL